MGEVNQTNVKLLNKIEKKALRYDFKPYDAIAAAALLFPETTIETMNEYNATMELTGQYTRGQMFINPLSTDHNVKIIEKMSEDEFKKIMLWTANF